MQRDAIDWTLFLAQVVSAIGTVAAIWYAAVANRNARRSETRSRDALVRERRIDFQLDLLKELGEFNQRPSNVAFASSEFTLRARLLPVHLIPLARAAVRLNSTPDALALVEEQRSQSSGVPVRDLMKKQVDSEIAEAIERLLTERYDGAVEGRSLPTSFRVPRWVGRLWSRPAAANAGNEAAAAPESTA